MKKFFVYGTLKEGGRFARRFDDLRKTVLKGSVRDVDMLDLGGFPGAVNGEGVIQGEVHEYDNEEKVLDAFDMIEGYNRTHPEHSFYIRKEVEVALESGDKTTATMYFLNAGGDGRSKVESGVWDISR